MNECSKRTFVLSMLATGVLTACGGGGGDSGSTTPVATLAITSTNQDGVARAATSAAASVGTAGGGLTGSSGAAASLSTATRRAALALSSARKSALAAQPLASQSETYQCSYSGSVTLTVNDANNNNAGDAGDSLTFAFNSCKETANDSASGTLAITLSSYTATANGANFAGTMAFNLTAADGTRTSAITGSVGVSYSDLSSTSSSMNLTVGSNGLSSSVTAGGVTESITYESGFTISETDTSTGSTLTIAGGIQSSVLAGRIVIATPTAIVQSTGALYPSSGQLLVTGTSGSALRITVLSATQVQLDLDADGNGSYEATKTVAWSTVLPS